VEKKVTLSRIARSLRIMLRSKPLAKLSIGVSATVDLQVAIPIVTHGGLTLVHVE
jgi:hypothetical protein